MATLVVLAGLGHAQAQSLTLSAPDTQVTDCTVRGGSYANAHDNGTRLVTRASTNAEYVRRSLLKFDTDSTIAKGAAIRSATLTVTLRGAGSTTRGTRTITAVPVLGSFIENEATWMRRKTSHAWTQAGGDLGSTVASATVGAAGGQKVTFDVTAYVQDVVNGKYSSRYARLALVDLGASTSASYREFYASESADPSVRPVLSVTLGSPAPAQAPAPAPDMGTGAVATIRVLHWNIHHGVGTDGQYNLDRLATWMVKMTPDVISLNESERFDSWGNEDQPLRFKALLEAKTGRTWYVHDAQRYGQWTAAGQVNTLLSTFPIVSEANNALPYSRSQGLVSIVVNGRNVVISNTHIDEASQSYRIAQINDLLPWTAGFATDRLVMGDFNAQPTATEIATMVAPAYYDGWAEAKTLGTATAYPDNPNGNTRNSRIDYVFVSKLSANLAIKAAQVYDTRDANGVRPSDHHPLVVTVEVR